MSKQMLSIFAWTDSSTEGGPDMDIGEINIAGELDLTDKQAKRLCDDIRFACNHGTHVTFRVRTEATDDEA